MTDNETPAERTIREAVESVERLEREGQSAAPPSPEEESRAPIEGAVSSSAEAQDEGAEGERKDPREAMLEAMIHAKQEAQGALLQTQKEAKDLFDRLARVSADFENFKKRQTREKQDSIKFANEGVFKELLPVLDNLHRAVSAAADGGTLAEGVKLVLKQFEDVLQKFGVSPFSSQGEPFDPSRHEAIGTRPDENVPAQHVSEEYQRGYMLQDRLLRPALVIVSSGHPDEASQTDTPPESH